MGQTELRLNGVLRNLHQTWPLPSWLWGKGLVPPRGRTWVCGEPTRRGRSDGGKHGDGGEHHLDRSAGGYCYDGTTFSKENTLIGEGT